MNSNEAQKPNVTQLSILGAMQDGRKHVYGGTVPAAEIARRRAAGRRAKAARKVQR